MVLERKFICNEVFWTANEFEDSQREKFKAAEKTPCSSTKAPLQQKKCILEAAEKNRPRREKTRPRQEKTGRGRKKTSSRESPALQPKKLPQHAMFQDRFKDVQVGSRWFSTLYILSPNFHRSGSSHPHTCRSTSSHSCRSRSSHHHTCRSRSSHLHTCRSRSSHPHTCRSASSHLTADLHHQKLRKKCDFKASGATLSNKGGPL